MPNQPNVLLISTDHWPASLLGAAGHPTIETPTLDQLAANGVRFTNAYAECPVCIPARRTLMTGTPPRVHGDRVFKPDATIPALPTLAQTLRDAGYQAVGSGRIHGPCCAARATDGQADRRAIRRRHGVGARRNISWPAGANPCSGPKPWAERPVNAALAAAATGPVGTRGGRALGNREL